MRAGGPRNGRHGRAAIGLLAVLCCARAFAIAAPPPIDYRIASGALDDVLHALARQGDVQLIYDAALTRDKRSAGVKGHRDASGALDEALKGSGLKAVPVDGKTFVLRRLPPPPPPIDKPLPHIEELPLATRLMPVEVTGSHIRRTDVETASPMTVITRDEIEHSGYQTLYDLLRARPGIRVSNSPVSTTDGAVYQNNGLSGASGAAAVDLRGLGSAATLFLIDGQRMAGYGLAQDDFSVVNDLNSIPLALVERVDILRDGASAIYGSDAMAGVINVVLRKNATGVTLDGSYGWSARGDARQRRATASFGGSFGDNGHAMFSIDYLRRDPLLGRDRSWAALSDEPTLGGRSTPSNDGFVLDRAQVRFLPADCEPTKRNRLGICLDDGAGVTSLQGSLNSRSLMARVDRRFGDVEAYADARWTRVEQGQQSAPVKDSLQLPVGHPDNRGPGILTVYDYTFADLGPVRDSTVSISRFLTLGLRGSWGDGEWDVHLNDQHNDSSDVLMGLLREDTFADAVRRGSFHIDTVNTPEVRSAIAPVLHRRAETTQNGISAHVSHPVGELPGGTATVAVGMEAYRDRLHDTPDPLVLTSRVFQFQTPSIRREDRWSSAAYVESYLPVTRRFDVDVAWRFDRSKGYGHAWSPKVGLSWKALDGLTFRGTWARGYRAPTLLQLSRPATLASAGFLTQVPNNVLPCAERVPIDRYSSYCELRLNSINNPQLRPETSSSYTLGVIWAPTDAASITLDYFRIRRDNEINVLPITYVLAHPRRYPRLFERNASGELVALNQQLANLGKTDARVIDLESRYRFEPGRWGRFDVRFDANYLKRLDRTIVSGMPVDHYAGYASQPRWTALLGADWRYGDWTTTVNVRYTGSYRYETSSGSFQTCPDYLSVAGKCTTPAFVLVDLNLAYAGIRDWTIAFNVHNLFDHSPAYYGSPGTAYNPLFDDVVGRAYQLSFTWHPR